MPFEHVTVMLDEAIRYLNCAPGKIYVDGTLGGSGHARAIADRIRPDGRLIGMDQDPDAFAHAQHVFDTHALNIHLFCKNFIHLPEILLQLDIAAVDGILLDLGLSLHQLEASGRGFSYQREEPLDMRMDTATDITAEKLVNTLPERDLHRLFREYGEERWSGRIARRIAEERRRGAIRTTDQLRRIVLDAIPAKARQTQKIHPATRVFMALRIGVNKELERLGQFMERVPDLLNPKGRLCVISFHSLEDRIVKHRIRRFEAACRCPPDFPRCTCGGKPVMRRVHKKALSPSAEEIANNPRSRSARLRVAERV